MIDRSANPLSLGTRYSLGLLLGDGGGGGGEGGGGGGGGGPIKKLSHRLTSSLSVCHSFLLSACLFVSMSLSLSLSLSV